MYSIKMFYVFIIAALLIVYVVTLNYKMGLRSKENKCKYKFWFLCGMSMYIVDKFRRKRIFGGKVKLCKKLKKLHIKDMVEEDEYTYTVDKVSLSIMIFTGIMILGMIMVYSDSGSRVNITKLDRPGYGEVPKEYLLEVENDTEKETIHVMVREKQYKKEEILEKLEQSYKQVVEIMLDKNRGLSEICSDLRFDPEYEKEGIALSWGTDNPDVIGYDGKVCRQEQSADLTIYLTMSFAGIAKTYDVNVTVAALKQSGTFESKVQKIVDSYDNYNDKVILPEKVDGKAVNYFSLADKTYIPFAFAAIIISVMVFIIKDKDIDKELEKRKMQMESDYSEIVSKLTLLNSSGMNIRAAWKRIISDYERSGSRKELRYAYEEMKLAENKMESGSSEEEAYHDFGKRCGLHNYVKLAGILEQNLIKGTKGMNELLEFEVHEAFEERKKLAKKHGDEAGTKMLIPMAIMLVVSIIIVIIPSFISMGMI